MKKERSGGRGGRRGGGGGRDRGEEEEEPNRRGGGQQRTVARGKRVEGSRLERQPKTGAIRVSVKLQTGFKNISLTSTSCPTPTIIDLRIPPLTPSVSALRYEPEPDAYWLLAYRSKRAVSILFRSDSSRATSTIRAFNSFRCRLTTFLNLSASSSANSLSRTATSLASDEEPSLNPARPFSSSLRLPLPASPAATPWTIIFLRTVATVRSDRTLCMRKLHTGNMFPRQILRSWSGDGGGEGYPISFWSHSRIASGRGAALPWACIATTGSRRPPPIVEEKIQDPPALDSDLNGTRKQVRVRRPER
ncbi:hypothetical protein MUK42_31628 [Musa troglodytarum]|uniref:Uncharacterized protein n=1 Tax=Musa troglodytarum TaxID=320322 RepID=A0A9E7FFW4_9LILI|nr:hypothetical protein MUK42_31628 [Musa troglodytarum]